MWNFFSGMYSVNLFVKVERQGVCMCVCVYLRTANIKKDRKSEF